MIVMKTIPAKFLTAAALATLGLFTGKAYAQSNYNTALGVRMGWTTGVNVKFGAGKGYLDVLLGSRPYVGSLTVLYEVQKQAGEGNMQLYYGAGGHIATINHRYYYGVWKDRVYYTYYNEMAYGIDGVLGLEIPITGSPVLIGLEVKPYMEFYGNGYRSISLDPGLNIRIKL